MNENANRISEKKKGRPSADVPLAMVIVAGFSTIFMLAQWREVHPRQFEPGIQDENLYLNGATAKRFSLGFNGLIADWYWMRALQYVGRKVASETGHIRLDDLRSLNLNLLAPLLDTAVTLDPRFMEVYEFGAMVLPAINKEDAVALTKKGISANPFSWHLYQHLGYIYWQQGDYGKASEAYVDGSRLPGAPKWMEAMSARMAAEGGSRLTAREMYKRMYDESNDAQVKQIAVERLAQLKSFDERDVIRRILTDFSARNKQCVSSWKNVRAALSFAHIRMDASGAPLDPGDTAYRLTSGGCDVDLDPLSPVPYR